MTASVARAWTAASTARHGDGGSSHPRAAVARLVVFQLAIQLVVQLAVHRPSQVLQGPAHPPGPLRGRRRVAFSTRPPRGPGREKSGWGGVFTNPHPTHPIANPRGRMTTVPL